MGIAVSRYVLSVSSTSSLFSLAALVNFITADKAVCVFPTETIIERTAYVTMAHQKPGATTLDWISKYQGRGYRVLGAKDIPGTSTSIYGARHTEDSLSWVIPFCTGSLMIVSTMTSLLKLYR